MTESPGYVPPAPIPPLHWQQKYAALRDLFEAYAGLPADDAPGRPSAALTEYLAVTAFASPEAPALAAAQLRALLERGRPAVALSAPGDEDRLAFALLPWPASDEATERWPWMAVVADLLAQAVDSAAPARTGPPRTPWGWRRSFPRLHQLFAGYFGQDFPTEHPDPEPAAAERAAVQAWRRGASPAVQARANGELRELRDLRLDRAELELALGALGRDVELLLDPHLWLRRLSSVLRG